jgi:biotin synthase
MPRPVCNGLDEADMGTVNSTAESATRLFAFARDIRDKHVGPRIDMRAAIDVGNVCRVNCHYCPMRRDNLRTIGKNGRGTISACRADSTKIIEVANDAYRLGFRELFLQSGEDPHVVAQVETAVSEITKARSGHYRLRHDACVRFLRRVRRFPIAS